jgi:peptidoglycan/xylan/chitin deacetylase (PgdA/CDA1 family)
MISSLSCDLDDKWSYLKTHGDDGWKMLPSFLEIVVPRILAILKRLDLQATFFIVGQDASLRRNSKLLRSIHEAGHEIGNHSHKHEPWLHLYSKEEIGNEIALAEKFIEQATGQRPVGFRGPGYSLSHAAVRELVHRGYLYDATTFPSLLTPLVRLYYFSTANFTASEKRQRRALGGKMRDGLRSNRPYYWNVDGKRLLEIPVTTVPLFKMPMHMSYLFGLQKYFRPFALTYFDTALYLCRMTKVAPSILLHPTDFLGREDKQGLEFIPGMDLPLETKLDFVCEVMERLRRQCSVLTLRDHAMRIIPNAMLAPSTLAR